VAETNTLLDRLQALTAPEACLTGTPMVPIHQETLKEIIRDLEEGLGIGEARPALAPFPAHIRDNTILLQSGAYLDLVDPDPDVITIQDVAHGLSHVCRFGGQCRTFYSVAEHSVHVSRLVPPAHALDGLLHDAAEAFIGDVVKPLKVVLPDYARIERHMEAVIFEKFLGRPWIAHDEVKKADLTMLATEQRHLMARDGVTWKTTEGRTPTAMHLPCWGPAPAKLMFLERYQELI
jgi:hypothetical protein